MSFPSHVQSSAGAVATTGTQTVSMDNCVAGNLVIFHLVTRGDTEDWSAFSSVTNLEDLSGVDDDTTGIQTGLGIGSGATSRHALFAARVMEDGTCSASFTVGASDEDMYCRMYEFAGVSLGLTREEVFENDTTYYGATDGTSTTIADAAVVTNGPNRLALQFVAIAGDLAIDSMTGETGGDWTEVDSEYSTATGASVTLQLQKASMFEAGTINGGTLTIASTAWGTIGVALIPSSQTVEYCEYQELGPSRIRGRAAVSDPTEEGPDPVGVPVYSAGAGITADSGTAHTDSTLYADPGTWTNTPTSYTYHWYVNDAATGQTSSSLYLPDIGAVDNDEVKCAIRAFNASGGGITHFSNTLTLIPTGGSAPVNVTPPVLTGDGGVGDTMTVGHDGWINSPTSYAHKWFRTSFQGSRIALEPSALQDWTTVQGFLGNTTFQTYGVRHVGFTVPIGENPGHWVSDAIPLTGSGSQLYASGEAYQNHTDVGNASVMCFQYDSMDVQVSVGPITALNETDTGYFALTPEYVELDPSATYVKLWLVNAGGASLSVIQEVRFRNLVLHRGETSTPVEIGGETGQTYVIDSADIGWTVMAQVEATNDFGSSSYVSSNESSAHVPGPSVFVYNYGANTYTLSDVASDGSFVLLSDYYAQNDENQILTEHGVATRLGDIGSYMPGITGDNLVMVEDWATGPPATLCFIYTPEGTLGSGPIGDTFDALDDYGFVPGVHGATTWVNKNLTDGDPTPPNEMWDVGNDGSTLDLVTEPPANDWLRTAADLSVGVLAPDATWGVIQRDGYSNGWIWDTIGSAPIDVRDGGDGFYPTAFARDSSCVFGYRPRGGFSTYDLVIIASDGTDVAEVEVGLTGYPTSAASSPDSTYFVYINPDTQEIIKVDADGTNPTVLYSDDDVDGGGLSYISHGGTEIAFVNYTTQEACLIKSDGSDYRAYGTGVIGARVSLDGSRLWWTEDDGGGGGDIYYQDLG